MSKKTKKHIAKGKETRRRSWVWVAILIILLLTAAIRIRLMEAPLERDEGEYAYAGQLILEGIPPYIQVYNMKMPGIYAAYAFILAVFGQTHSGIHLGLLLMNGASVLLLFLLAKRLFGPVIGVVTAAAFALLSLGQSVQGIFANAEHFVILPALCGILLLLRFFDTQRLWHLLASALLLGLAFIMKQPGAAFIVFAAVYLFFRELHLRPFNLKTFVTKVFLFLIGVLLPFAVTCLILWWAGAFKKFWFWTFDYAQEYTSSLPLSVGFSNLRVRINEIAGSAILLWILVGIGLTALCWNKKARQSSLFVVGFLLFSFLATCPGFYFRPHYFILFLPAVALLAGIGAGSVHDLFSQSRSILITKVIPILLVLIVLFHAAYKQRNFFFVMSPTEASRMIYGANPFPESLEIARFIAGHSSKNDHIAVIGSEPQIYFYSKRRSATGYIYTYALMEDHSYAQKMQQEMILEIESVQPRFLIFVSVSTSWLVKPDSEKMIFTWFNQYQKKYYRRVGIIDILLGQPTVYRWGQESLGYSPRSKYWLAVFERID